MFLLIVGGTLAGDLVAKSLAFQCVAGQPVHLTAQNAADRDTIPPHPPLSVVPHVLSLKLTTNTGAVFGLGKGSQWLFVLVTFAAVAVIGWVFCRSPAGARWQHLCLALILAGALGNLYDRIRFNAVRDLFWLFPGGHLPFGWSWPGGATDLYPWIFNVADAALVVGVVVMLVLMWRRPADAGDTPAPGGRKAAG